MSDIQELAAKIPQVWEQIQSFMNDQQSAEAVPVNGGTGNKLDVIKHENLLIVRLGGCAGSDITPRIQAFTGTDASAVNNTKINITEQQWLTDDFEAAVFVKTDQPEPSIGVIARFQGEYQPGGFDIFSLKPRSPQLEVREWTTGGYVTDEQAAILITGILVTRAFEMNIEESDTSDHVIAVANDIMKGIMDENSPGQTV